MKAIFTLLMFASALFRVHMVSAAGQPIEVKQLSFPAGASSTTVKSAFTGEKTVDYRLRAKAGQTMSVKLQTSNTSNYFNVLPPSSETALFVGSTSGNTWTDTLATDGDYTVRVYLMRNAARRNEKANYTLTVGITPGPAGAARKGDAKVAGTPYHATGKVPCSIGTHTKGSQQCAFGVIRGKAGHAEVHLTAPGGTQRVLNFAGKQLTIADRSARLKASKYGDEWSIDINDHEHYVIPAAVISGG
jgi:hypothetical protein